MSEPTESRVRRWLPLPAFLLLVLLMLPLILGSQTLFFRDVFNTHLPLKASQAEAMKQGYLPLVDLYRGGGQPALGNPNGVFLYPTTLLYLVAEPIWALNAHFWIHLLLAPGAVFLLGRAFGLSRAASWASGFCYAVGGFFLSQMNLYNLVAGAALTPAFVASALSATEPSVRRATDWWTVAVGALWALLLVAGDPIYALIALMLAGLALLAHRGIRWLRRLPALVAAMLAGTLLAAPQWVEFLRILGLSYRGHRGYDVGSRLLGSWDPQNLLDWLLPLPWGGLSLQFWGTRFFDTQVPLFLSLAPGLLTLALLMVSGLRSDPERPLGSVRLFAWAAVILGLLVSLGRFNPVVAWLVSLPGGDILRFPVKLWLATALGMALLAGVGWDRTVGARRAAPLARALLVLALVYVAFWSLNHFGAQTVESWIAQYLPPSAPEAAASFERLRWSQLCSLSLLGLGLLALSLWLSRRRPTLGGALLLMVHCALQIVFLRALLPTDAREPYLEAPAVASSLRAGERIVHSGIEPSVMPTSARPEYPDASLLWVQRRAWAELYPMVGVRLGHRYDLDRSPEGLDSFLTLVAASAIAQLDTDAQRLRMLAALGIDGLITYRPLDGSVEDEASLRARDRNYGVDLYVYGLDEKAEEVQLLGDVRPAPIVNDAVMEMIAPDFSPRGSAVLAGDFEPLRGGRGRVEVLARGPESLQVRTRSADEGVLVWQRSHLPLYRATIDGREVPTRVANLTRLAVKVPAGEHEVRIWVDRRPTRVAFALSIAGLLLLGALVSRTRRSDD
jgi:hypothetical protein